MLLSEEAIKKVPYNIECKNLNKIAVYKYYEQAESHGSLEPLVVIKANRKKPLAIVDLKHFLYLLYHAKSSME